MDEGGGRGGEEREKEGEGRRGVPRIQNGIHVDGKILKIAIHCVSEFFGQCCFYHVSISFEK